MANSLKIKGKGLTRTDREPEQKDGAQKERTIISRSPRDLAGTLGNTSMSQMPDAEYRRIKAVNYSGLKLFAECPLYYWEQYLNPDREPETESPALRIGTAGHLRILEGAEIYHDTYIREPSYDKRLKANKDHYQEWLANKGDRIPLPADEWDMVERMAAAVLGSPLASALVEGKGGYSEEVCQAIDPETGMLLKCKADRIATIGGKTYVIDLKTCSRRYGGAGQDGFGKSVAKFKYHWQAAFYTDLIGASGDWGPVENFVFVVVEKESPHAVAIYECDDQMMEAGRMQYREALHRFKECQEKDQWPGFDTQITSLSLPRWAL